MIWKIPYGHSKIKFFLPDIYDVKELCPKSVSPIKDLKKSLIQSINNPISSSSLKDIISKRKGNIVVVIDDYTRKFPFKQVLPFLLEYVEEFKNAEQQITLMIASGTHRPPNEKEIKDMIGEIALNYTIKCSHPTLSTYKNIGTTKRGTPVNINEDYLQNEIKIALTDVTLHYFAGFGGDRKSIVPGLSNLETIESNHRLMFEKGVGVGILDGNPVHEDMLEGARMAEPDFVINICLDDNYQIFNITSGKLFEAFKISVAEYRKYYQVSVSEEADILIMSQGGSPYDINYYQSQKALQQCLNVLKPGGILIYATESPNGIGNNILENTLRIYDNPSIIYEKIKHHFSQGLHNAYFQLKFVERNVIYLKSNLEHELVESVLRMKPICEIQDLINSMNLENKRIYIIKHGSKMMAKKGNFNE